MGRLPALRSTRVALRGFSSEINALKKPNDERLPVAEVAEFLKLHRETVCRMIKSGELPALNVGRAGA